MLDLNVYSLMLAPLMLLILFAVLSRLLKQLANRQLTSHVPSATKTLWSELRVSWRLATMQLEEKTPFVEELLNKYGPVVHFNIAGRPFVIINDPNDLKILLSSAQHVNKSRDYDMLKPWLNEGLLLSSGSKWLSRRKLLTNAFHFKSLELYNPSMNRYSRVLAKKLLEASEKQGEINIQEYVTLCSLDILCETIMGATIKAQEGESIEYVHSIKSACHSVASRHLKFWLWNDQVFRISKFGRTFYKSIEVLHNYTNKVIQNKRILLNESKTQTHHPKRYDGKQRKSFLDILITLSDEYPDQMTDADIREELDTFLFEGHDTTSIALTMTLTLLGIYQNVQDRVRDELYCIFGDSDRDATMEDLTTMKYLEAVIKESLRLYPSVPTIARKILTTLNITNFSIPPMTTVIAIPIILHRNKDIYPNPEEFLPDRFLNDENKSKFLFGYLPFSAGSRNCIGQKYAMNLMKTVLSIALRKMKVETLGSKEDIKLVGQIILRVLSTPKLKLTAIN